MTLSFNSADASFYYYEDASADVAKMDTSAVYGNLADAMKNSVVTLPNSWTMNPVEASTPDANSVPANGEKNLATPGD